MGFKYIISDIHGCYDAFFALLDMVGFSPKDELLILGDVVDRGTASIRLLQYIMAADNMKMLLGNHEDLMFKVVSKPEEQDTLNYIAWMQNGGAVTHMHYKALSPAEQEGIVSYLQALPLYIAENGYLFVHAGINIPEDQADLPVCIEQTSREEFFWLREAFMDNPNQVKDHKIIFGHTPTTFLGLPEAKFWSNEKGDKLCIDCGKVYGGRLGLLRLEDMKEFYL